MTVRRPPRCCGGRRLARVPSTHQNDGEPGVVDARHRAGGAVEGRVRVGHGDIGTELVDAQAIEDWIADRCAEAVLSG